MEQSAITIGGQEGDGARVKIDIPGTEGEAIQKLQKLRGVVFKVTIEPQK